MSQIATTARSTAPLAELPESLASAVRAITHATTDGHYVAPNRPSEAMIQLSRAWVPDAATAASAVSPELLRAWLERLAIALPVGGVKDNPNALRNAIQAVVMAVGDMPAECFTAGTMRAVLRHPDCRFFPGPAVLFAILEPTDRAVKARLAALRAIAATPPPEPEWRGPKDEAERQDMREKMAALAAEMRENAQSREVDHAPPKARHCSALELALASKARGMPIEHMPPNHQAALKQHMAKQEART
jgi:hypothetical protein